MKNLLIAFFFCFSTNLIAQEVSGGLGFTGLNHLALQVSDMPASKNFYQNIIGLTPVAVPDSMKAIRGWFDTGNGQMIHLLAGRTTPVVNDKNGSHFAIFVQSIEAAEKFLIARKIQFHKQVRFDKAVQIYFSDPDGYLIEMNQRK
jgi:catechol 2,3-dioxygenase-like lactoylglutathione lyase family enzyme